MQTAEDIVVEILKFLGGLLLVAVPIVATFGSGIYVLRPLDRAARRFKNTVHFTIIDALALVTHLSIPLGFVGRISRYDGGSRGQEYLLVGFGCFAAIMIWSATVATAARAGITEPTKRLMMIGLIVPLTFVVTIVFGPLLSVLLYHLFHLSDRISPWLYVLEVSLAVLIIGCRRAVDWILKAPQAIPIQTEATKNALS
jgi:MFS family permease